MLAELAAASRRRREAKEAEARRIVRRNNKIERWTEYIVAGIAATILAVLIFWGIILYVRYLR
jgi:hypothetical protein